MRFVTASLVLFAMFTGCRTTVVYDDPPPRRTVVVEEQGPSGEVVETHETTVVETAPPAEQVDVVAVGVAPGPDYVWVQGYWRWNGRVWVRVGGHWHRRPYGYRYYRPGCWVYRGGRHCWQVGVWVR